MNDAPAATGALAWFDRHLSVVVGLVVAGFGQAVAFIWLVFGLKNRVERLEEKVDDACADIEDHDEKIGNLIAAASKIDSLERAFADAKEDFRSALDKAAERIEKSNDAQERRNIQELDRVRARQDQLDGRVSQALTEFATLRGSIGSVSRKLDFLMKRRRVDRAELAGAEDIET